MNFFKRLFSKKEETQFSESIENQIPEHTPPQSTPNPQASTPEKSNKKKDIQTPPKPQGKKYIDAHPDLQFKIGSLPNQIITLVTTGEPNRSALRNFFVNMPGNFEFTFIDNYYPNPIDNSATITFYKNGNHFEFYAAGHGFHSKRYQSKVDYLLNYFQRNWESSFGYFPSFRVRSGNTAPGEKSPLEIRDQMLRIVHEAEGQYKLYRVNGSYLLSIELDHQEYSTLVEPQTYFLDTQPSHEFLLKLTDQIRKEPTKYLSQHIPIAR